MTVICLTRTQQANMVYMYTKELATIEQLIKYSGKSRGTVINVLKDAGIEVTRFHLTYLNKPSLKNTPSDQEVMLNIIEKHNLTLDGLISMCKDHAKDYTGTKGLKPLHVINQYKLF